MRLERTDLTLRAYTVGMLEQIRGPADLQHLTQPQLTDLADEIRQFLIHKVAATGGHLGPNLGVVELTLALHRVFDSPHDPIIFDTGHQAYVHKMLTGRCHEFDTLRKKGGLSGYPSRSESEHDWVESSHASSALSYADGLAKAFALTGHRNRHVVAVVGDAALTGGMCWEALNNIATSSRPVVIIVNDNGRSYAPTIGGFAEHLAALRLQPGYEKVLDEGRRAVRGVPVIGEFCYQCMHSIKAGIKDALSPQVMFTDLGLKYVGPIDGHDEHAVEAALRHARGFNAPVIVHVVTRKGMGYAPAEDDEEDQMHSTGVIDPLTGLATSVAGPGWTSAFPQWHVNRVELALGFVVILMLGNLRGIRESGQIFAVPTYFFIVTTLTLIAVGIWHAITGTVHPVTTVAPLEVTTQPLTLFLLLTAFSNGCTAMTGVEAVSNGVPAFQPPESRNAASTMLMMAVLSITMFLGITLLAQAYHVIPSEQETVVSQLARGVFGDRGLPYYAVQAATMLILVLAANTAYADFPRLASLLARDRYVPRQFMNQGDRLAFSNGIVGLSIFAAVLLVIFGGDTHALIPLYMIGVFVSFTLSQAGMVIRWRRLGGPGWRTSATVNGVGALVTGIVLVIVAVTKAAEGAWLII